jgi:branched-chain amino acid transport system substrate-binding protein
MTKRMRKSCLVVSLLTATLLFSAFSSCRSPGTPNTIKIGVVLPLTGGTSIAGLKIQKAYQLAAEEINGAGGVKIGDRLIPLELKFGDSEGKPDVGASETERLINQEKVVAIAGCYESAVAIPTTVKAEQYHTPYVVDNPIADQITERGLKYVFRVTVKADWLAKAELDFLKAVQQQKGTPIQKIALLYEDTQFGQSSAAGQKKYAQQSGVTLAGEFTYSHNATDVTSTIAKLRSVDPDVVIATSYTSDAILIARTMAELNYYPKLAFLGSTAGHQDPNFISNLGQLSEGILTFSFWNKDLKKPGAQQYYERFKQRFGEDPVPQCVNARSAIWVIKDALQRAGSVDREKLRDALRTTNITGNVPPVDVMPFDAIRFDDAGQNMEAKGMIMQIQGQQFVTVWPSEAASKAIIWPVPSPYGKAKQQAAGK